MICYHQLCTEVLCSFWNHLHRCDVIEIDLEDDPVLLDSIILQFHLECVRISQVGENEKWIPDSRNQISIPPKKLSLFLERHEFITVITGSDAVLGCSGVLSDRFLELFELRQGHGGWLLSFLSITLVPAVRIFDTVRTTQIWLNAPDSWAFYFPVFCVKLYFFCRVINASSQIISKSRDHCNFQILRFWDFQIFLIFSYSTRKEIILNQNFFAKNKKIWIKN